MQMRDRAKNKAKARRCPQSVLTTNQPREFRFLSALAPWQDHVGTALAPLKTRCLGDHHCRRWPNTARRACTNACIAQSATGKVRSGRSASILQALRTDSGGNGAPSHALRTPENWQIVLGVCRHERSQAICTHCPIDACHCTMVWRRHPACGVDDGKQAGRHQPLRPAARCRAER